ncbi:hypothetical protein KSP35_07640 [Aquihabitans sp. G128]|uniref:hypothetical protein n=1 Tax=Aquihabitans sp. G128 TaxID=2849779 RepID=UPI001C2142B0|nr:hypothetical protein [Aquihabitans sp. G128]QXC62657.1 hypothetical protein KSP35_07640 [Aquihabitans sp. G128]
MAVACLLLATAAVAVPSGATPRAVGDEVAFDGTVSGTGTFDGDQDCGLDVDVTQDATLTLAAGGEAQLHLAYCLAPFDPAVALTPTYDGTFTIAGDAGTVSGTLVGTVAAAAGPGATFATHLVLTASSGTGDLAGATGELTFDGAAGFGASTLEGTLAGSLTIGEPPATAPSTAPPTSGTLVGAVVPSSPPPPPGAAPVSGTPAFTG